MSKRTDEMDIFGRGDWISQDRLLVLGIDPADLVHNGSLHLPIKYNDYFLFQVKAEIRLRK